MHRVAMPFALRERLGREAADGLAQVLDEREQNVQEHVLNLATERFGRMLAEEAGKLRVELADECGRLRAEFGGECGKLRAEFAGECGRLRAEFAGESGKLRAQMADVRSDLLKWAFLFWIGQVAAVAGLLAVMLRGVGR